MMGPVEGNRDDQNPARPEDSGDVAEQCAGTARVLQHLSAQGRIGDVIREIDSFVGDRDVGGRARPFHVGTDIALHRRREHRPIRLLATAYVEHYAPEQLPPQVELTVKSAMMEVAGRPQAPGTRQQCTVHPIGRWVRAGTAHPGMSQSRWARKSSM